LFQGTQNQNGEDDMKNEQQTPKPTSWYFDPPEMTLRDWFAGQALNGLLSNPEFNHKVALLVELGYQIADAMMKAREQQ
jgi:hypothetical protein